MKNQIKTSCMKSLQLLSLFLMTFLLSSCDNSNENINQEQLESEALVEVFENEFTLDYKKSIQKPEWYDSASYVELRNFADLQKLWGSRKHCCVSKSKLVKNHRELFRSCHEAILKYPQDDQLVFNCLYLQGNDIAASLRHELKRLGYYHYPDFKTDFEQYRCANCMAADKYARLTKSHALIVARTTGSYDEGLGVLDDLIERRIDEISPWIQSELFTEYAKMMSYQSKYSGARFDRLLAAYKRLKDRADSGDETLSWRIKNLEKSISRLER